MVRERPGSRHVCGGSLDSRSWKRRLTDSSCYGSLKGRLRLHVYGMTHRGKNKHTLDLLMCRATAKERATCDHAHIISSVYLCCGRRLWRAPSRRVTVQHDEPHGMVALQSGSTGTLWTAELESTRSGSRWLCWLCSSPEFLSKFARQASTTSFVEHTELTTARS